MKIQHKKHARERNTVCGIKYDNTVMHKFIPEQLVGHWRKVTCKRCLKLRDNYEGYKKKFERMDLQELMEEIRKRFRIKLNQKYDIHCFYLVYWQRGMWNINVIDDWHKWSDAGIEKPRDLYYTPEAACKGFLNYVEKNKINLRKLQSRT